MSVTDSSTNTLEVLQKKGDDYQCLISAERKRLQELSAAIAHVDSQVDFYRQKAKESAIEVMNKHILTPKPAFQKADGAEIGKQAEIVERKTMEMLEMKLNKIKQRNNEIESGNLLLSQRVNHMRKWKMQTELAHKNAESEMFRLKDQIRHVMDHCNELKSKRDDVIEKRGELIHQNRQEGERFEAEYENLGKYVITQNKQLEFSLLQERKSSMKDLVTVRNMNMIKKKKKQQKRNEDKLLLSSTSRNTLDTLDSCVGFNTQQDGSALSMEPRLKQLQPLPVHETKKSKRKHLTEKQLNQDTVILDRIRQLDELIATYDENLSNIQTRISSYSDVLNQIRRSIGIHDIDDSLQTYAKQEEEMFSVYSYIQSLSSELEWLEEQKTIVKQEMTKYRTNQESMEEERKGIITSLHDKITNMVEVKHQLKSSLETGQSSVESVGKKVHAMFFKLQCDQMTSESSRLPSSSSSTSSRRRPKAKSSTDITNKVTLLSSQGISESNVLDFLSVLEERAMEIVTAFLKKSNQSDDEDEERLNPLLGPKTPAMTSTSYPPSLTDVGQWISRDGSSMEGDKVDEDDEDDAGSVVDINQFKESLQARAGDMGTFLTQG